MVNGVGNSAYPPQFIELIQKDHAISANPAVKMDVPQDTFGEPKKKTSFLTKAIVTLGVLTGAGLLLAKKGPKIKVADDATGVMNTIKKYTKTAGEHCKKVYDKIASKFAKTASDEGAKVADAAE